MIKKLKPCELFERLGVKNYKEYLKSKYWERAKKIYNSSGKPKECRCCGSKKYQLHHVEYKRLGGEMLQDLIPLCWFCHKKLHEVLKAKGWGVASTFQALKYVRKEKRSIVTVVEKMVSEYENKVKEY